MTCLYGLYISVIQGKKRIGVATPVVASIFTDSPAPLRSKVIVIEDTAKGAILDFSTFNSPGLDGVYSALISGRNISASLALKCIPKAWKVILLPKPGRMNYSIPKSYRPISLTSFSLRTLERLTERNIRDEVLRN